MAILRSVVLHEGQTAVSTWTELAFDMQAGRASAETPGS